MWQILGKKKNWLLRNKNIEAHRHNLKLYVTTSPEQKPETWYSIEDDGGGGAEYTF